MKKIQQLMAMATLMLLATACHIGGRHNVIIENNNGRTVKVEYRGQIFFTGDGKGIKFITPGGSVICDINGDDLVAENDHNRIVYEINGGGKQTRLDESDRKFLARAVHEMIRLGHHADR